MSILESVADRQAVWAETANALKSATDRARRCTFFASITGALLAALATQFFNNEQFNGVHQFLAVLSAISLAVGTFVTARWLSRDMIDRHLRARAASEALKREAFLYATSAGQYNNPETRDSVLLDQKNVIENAVDDLLLFEQTAKNSSDCPISDLNTSEYIEQRINTQIKYYRDRSAQYDKYSRWLHTLEWGLSLVAALTAAIAATPLFDIDFDLAAMTAVLTTLGGVVVSHLEAARFDKLIPAYRATANRLENIKLRMQVIQTRPTDWVAECERMLAEENSSWMGLWAKS